MTFTMTRIFTLQWTTSTRHARETIAEALRGSEDTYSRYFSEKEQHSLRQVVNVKPRKKIGSTNSVNSSAYVAKAEETYHRRHCCGHLGGRSRFGCPNPPTHSVHDSAVVQQRRALWRHRTNRGPSHC